MYGRREQLRNDGKIQIFKWFLIALMPFRHCLTRAKQVEYNIRYNHRYGATDLPVFTQLNKSSPSQVLTNN